jgi:hypothetical protein
MCTICNRRCLSRQVSHSCGSLFCGWLSLVEPRILRSSSSLLGLGGRVFASSSVLRSPPPRRVVLESDKASTWVSITWSIGCCSPCGCRPFSCARSFSSCSNRGGVTGFRRGRLACHRLDGSGRWVAVFWWCGPRCAFPGSPLSSKGLGLGESQCLLAGKLQRCLRASFTS